MSVSNCPSCNTPAPPGAVFCDNCGYDLRAAAPADQQPIPPTYHVSQPEGDVNCSACGHPNVAGSAFCENCGSQLAQAQPPAAPAAPPPTPAPAPFPPVEQAPAYTPPAPQPPPQAAPAPAPTPQAPPPAVSGITGRMVIQASNTSLPIPQGKQVIVIGREDPVSGIFPDIDLDPYGAQEDGVGRKHAQLIIRGGQVHVEDLNSVNGTAVNKQKLASGQAHPIKDGDELRFGKMVVIYYAS